MTNFHPKEYNLINLYEVVNSQGSAIWGGEDEEQAITWLRLHLTENARLLVSAWDSDEENAHMVGQPIDITLILGQTLSNRGSK